MTTKLRIRVDSAQKFMTIDEPSDSGFFDDYHNFLITTNETSIMVDLYKYAEGQQIKGSVKVCKFPQTIAFLRFGMNRWLSKVYDVGTQLVDFERTEFAMSTRLTIQLDDFQYSMRPPTTFEQADFLMMDKAFRDYYDEKDRQETIQRPVFHNKPHVVPVNENGTFQAALELINKSGFEVVDGQLTLQGKDGTQIVLSMKKQ